MFLFISLYIDCIKVYNESFLVIIHKEITSIHWNSPRKHIPTRWSQLVLVRLYNTGSDFIDEDFFLEVGSSSITAVNSMKKLSVSCKTQKTTVDSILADWTTYHLQTYGALKICLRNIIYPLFPSTTMKL